MNHEIIIMYLDS